MPRDNNSLVATKVAAGAPEEEIEITPEMIEAGMEVAYLLNEDLYDRRDSLANIFKVMFSSNPKYRLGVMALKD